MKFILKIWHVFTYFRLVIFRQCALQGVHVLLNWPFWLIHEHFVVFIVFDNLGDSLISFLISVVDAANLVLYLLDLHRILADFVLFGFKLPFHVDRQGCVTGFHIWNFFFNQLVICRCFIQFQILWSQVTCLLDKILNVFLHSELWKIYFFIMGANESIVIFRIEMACLFSLSAFWVGCIAWLVYSLGFCSICFSYCYC